MVTETDGPRTDETQVDRASALSEAQEERRQLPARRGERSADVGRGTSAPSSWGLGEGQAVPWEYAPAPESRDIVTIKPRYGLFIGGEEVEPTGGESFSPVDPA